MDHRSIALPLASILHTHITCTKDNVHKSQVDGLVLPRVLTLQVYGVEYIAYEGVDHIQEHDCILERKEMFVCEHVKIW